jgi:hypothetical protein
MFIPKSGEKKADNENQSTSAIPISFYVDLSKAIDEGRKPEEPFQQRQNHDTTHDSGIYNL